MIRFLLRLLLAILTVRTLMWVETVLIGDANIAASSYLTLFISRAILLASILLFTVVLGNRFRELRQHGLRILFVFLPILLLSTLSEFYGYSYVWTVFATIFGLAIGVFMLYKIDKNSA